MHVRIVILLLICVTRIALGQNGCIAGSVLDDGGSPLGQMHINVAEPTHNFYRSVQSDESGHFLVRDLPPGDYDIVTHNEELGYPDSNAGDFTNNYGRLIVAVTESQECTPVTIQREPRAGSLLLNLTDASTGEVIAKPEASFRRTDGFHAWNGLSLRGTNLLLPAFKPVEVHVGAKGYEPSDILKIAPLRPGERRELALALQKIGIGCLSGTVLDAGNIPVPKILMQLLLLNDELNAHMPLSTRSNEQGRFEVHNLHPGIYRLFVEDQERGYNSFSTMKAVGEYAEATVPASTNCTETTVVLTPPSAKLHVEILDATTGEPIKGFKLRVNSAPPTEGWYTESRTNEIVIPPNRACSIEVEAGGYQRSAPLSLGTFQGGEVRQLTIDLYPVAPTPTR